MKGKVVWCIGERMDGYMFLFSGKFLTQDMVSLNCFIDTNKSVEIVQRSVVFSSFDDAQIEVLRRLNENVKYANERYNSLLKIIDDYRETLRILTWDVSELKLWASQRLLFKFTYKL